MLTRGKLASRTGCNIETIRYYESIGLLPEPRRTPSGYRNYSKADERRLKFIQRARSLGFDNERIQDLLTLSDSGTDHTRAEVKSLTEAHIDDIAIKIRDLQKIRRRLQQISSYCDGSAKSASSCPILESLFEDD